MVGVPIELIWLCNFVFLGIFWRVERTMGSEAFLLNF